MNWIDYFIIGLSCLLGILGFRRGLIRELLSIASVIAGFVVALTSYETCASFLAYKLDMPSSFLNVLAFAMLFILVSMVLLFLGHLWKILTASTPVAFIDGLLGASFGLLKAAFVVSIILMLMVNIGLPAFQELLIGSYLAPHFLVLSSTFYEGIERILPVDISTFNILKQEL